MGNREVWRRLLHRSLAVDAVRNSLPVGGTQHPRKAGGIPERLWRSDELGVGCCTAEHRQNDPRGGQGKGEDSCVSARRTNDSRKAPDVAPRADSGDGDFRLERSHLHRAPGNRDPELRGDRMQGGNDADDWSHGAVVSGERGVRLVLSLLAARPNQNWTRSSGFLSTNASPTGSLSRSPSCRRQFRRSLNLSRPLQLPSVHVR